MSEDAQNEATDRPDGVDKRIFTFQTVCRAVYRALLHLDPERGRSKPTQTRFPFLKFAFCQGYTSICLLSYLDVIPLTSSDDGLWTSIHWVRFDYLLSRANMADVLLYLTWVLVVIHWVGVGYLAGVKNGGKNGYLQVAFPLLSYGGAAVGEIALCSILMARAVEVICKSEGGHLIERQGDPPLWTCYISLVIYLLYLPLQFLRSLKLARYQHSKVTSEVSTCAGIASEMVRMGSIHAITVSYYVCSSTYPSVHLAIVMASSLVILLSLYRRFPYYTSQLSGFSAANAAFLAASALSVLWASAIDSRLFVDLAIVLAAPLVGGLVYGHIVGTEEKAKNYYEKRLAKRLDVFQYELGVRRTILHCVVSKSHKDAESAIATLLSLFQTTENRRVKRILLWAADLASSVLHSPSLARLKLAQASSSPSSIEDDYFECCLHRQLNHSKPTEAFTFLKYMKQLKEIKARDKKLCHVLLEMYGELTSKGVERGKVLQGCEIVRREVKRLGKEYEKFVDTFSKVKEGYQMYASFLEDICHLANKAETMRLQGNLLKDTKGEGENVSLFNIDTCVVFVSCNPQSFGSISFANDLAHVTLGYQMGTLTGSHFSLLLPHHYRSFHSKKLLSFLRISTKTDFHHPSVLYLSTKFNCLIECFVNITITAHNDTPVLILAFRRSKSQREFALLTKSCIVAGTSDGFIDRLELESVDNIVGWHLKEVSGELWEARGKVRSSYAFKVGENDLGKFVRRKVGKEEIEIVYLLNSDEPTDDTQMQLDLFGSSTNRSNRLDTESRFESSSGIFRSFSLRQRHRKSSVQFGPSVNTDNDFKSTSKGMFPGARDSFLVAGAGNSYTRTRAGKGVVTRIRGSMLNIQILSVLLVIIIQAAILMAGNIIIGTFINSEVENTVQNDHTKHYILRELEVARIAQNARYIVMTAFLGVSSDSSVSLYKSLIKASADNLNSIEKVLVSDSTSEELSASVTIWELLDSEAIPSHVTLIDSVRRLMDHVPITQAMSIQDVPAPLLTSTHPSMFYLFRNGFGETKKALHASVFAYIHRAQAATSETISITSIYFLPPAIALVSGCVLLLFHLMRTQNSLNRLKSTLVAYPIGVYIELKQPVVERLSFYHGEEPNVGQGGGISDRGRRERCSRLTMGIGVLGGFLGVSLAAYGIEYLYLVQKMSSTMLMWPSMIELVVERITALVSLWAWMLENVFYSAPSVSIAYLPGLSIVSNPLLELKAAYMMLETLKSDILGLTVSGELVMSDSHFAYAYGGISSNCSHLYSGFDSGLEMIQEDTYYCAHNTAEADFYPTFRRLYVCVEEIVGSADSHIGKYYDDIENTLKEDMRLLVVSLTAHAVVCCALFAGLMLSGVSKVQSEARSVWKVLSFFPQEGSRSPSSTSPQKLIARLKSMKN